ncbi:MAG TPA: type II toxin-antitoxin system VapC family toxin [Gemmatimonadaceae bacterium]
MAKSRPSIVDSSGWLEYLADAPGADQFAPAIENTALLIVPSICVLEVFKKVLREFGEGEALQAIAVMQQGQVVDLDGSLALLAAKLGVEHKLPLADSVVYATAQAMNGIVWTQDEDFEDLPDAKFFRKSSRR